MAIMTHAKFHFNRLMLFLIFGIRASECPFGPGERLKRPDLIGLSFGLLVRRDLVAEYHLDPAQEDSPEEGGTPVRNCSVLIIDQLFAHHDHAF